MLNRVRRYTSVLAAVTALVGTAAAQDDFDLTYDVYLSDTCLIAWLDLSPLITAKSVQQLRDGVDLVIEYGAELRSPRRLWGAQLLASASSYLRLTHREVTSDFALLSPGDSLSSPSRLFGSLAGLHSYLRDSVELCLQVSDEPAETRCFVSFKITTTSLFDINLSPPTDDSESPLRFLFRQFLRMTDYGREEYSARSAEFRLSELDSIP